MATPPKTLKTTPAAPKRSVDQRVANKPAVKAAAAAKPPEDSVVHSTEIAAQAVESAKQATEVVAANLAEEVAKPAKAVIAQATAQAPEAVLQNVDTFLEFGRDNAILLVAAGNEFALGLHKLSLSLLDWSAESCDKSVAATSALLSAKTVEEVIDLSRSLAQDSLQHLLKEGSELGALSTRLFEDTFAPLPGRMAANVEKLASQAH